MNNLSELWAVLFFVSILTLITESSTLNWFEAQEQCRGRDGLTTSKNKSDQSYWTGRYRRITPWIKIKGCFSDSFLSNISTELYINVSMWQKAVGICQETCQRKNTTVFAVKGSECLCINSVGRMSWPVSADPSNCNFQCQNTNNIYKNECGGNSSYNVFEFISDIEHNNEGCMSLQCSRNDERFIPQPCSTILSKICHFQEASSSGYAGNWIEAMMDCKSANKPSYLFGDMDLHNAGFACSQSFIPEYFNIRWIGVARQVYNNNDNGLEIREEGKQSFLLCQSCNKTICKYISCNEKIQNSVFCVHQHIITVQTNSPRSSMDTTPIAMETKTRPNKQSATSSIPSTRNTTEQEKTSAKESSNKTAPKYGNPLVPIVVPVVLVLLVSAFAVVIGIHIRKKLSHDKDRKTEQIYSVLQERLDSNVENRYESLKNVMYENHF